jgi:hypothetical protein
MPTSWQIVPSAAVAGTGIDPILGEQSGCLSQLRWRRPHGLLIGRARSDGLLCLTQRMKELGIGATAAPVVEIEPQVELDRVSRLKSAPVPWRSRLESSTIRFSPQIHLRTSVRASPRYWLGRRAPLSRIWGAGGAAGQHQSRVQRVPSAPCRRRASQGSRRARSSRGRCIRYPPPRSRVPFAPGVRQARPRTTPRSTSCLGPDRLWVGPDRERCCTLGRKRRTA